MIWSSGLDGALNFSILLFPIAPEGRAETVIQENREPAALSEGLPDLFGTIYNGLV